jgi:hypothetical protein
VFRVRQCLGFPSSHAWSGSPTANRTRLSRIWASTLFRPYDSSMFAGAYKAEASALSARHRSSLAITR